MNRINNLLVVLLLAGCAQMPVADNKTEIREVPANLTARCPDLPAPPAQMNMGQLMSYNVDIMVMYVECADRHDELVKAAGGKTKLTK